MEVLTCCGVRADGANFRLMLRTIASAPPPAIPGLLGRHWRIDRRVVRGRYLFQEQSSLAAFASNPESDPAFVAIVDETGQSPEVAQTERIETLDLFDRPVFIVSAPRAGSTLLYELLTQASNVWATDGESEGVVEGIHALHPANRQFESHRLTELDASPDVARAIRAGFIAELRDLQGRRYLEHAPEHRPARLRMLEKTPENSLRIPFLASIFPDARFIFLHRDARQNISSVIDAWHHAGFVNIPDLPGWQRGRWHFLLPEGWRSLNGASLARVAAFQWSAANQRALDDLDAVPKDRRTSIDYAELVATPDRSVRRLCEFADLLVGDRLATSLRRPLPLASTTISPPSPIKWRSNPEFDEAALTRHTLVIARLRDLGRHAEAPAPRRLSTVPVRFSCFVDELVPKQVSRREDVQVVPSLQFQFGATIPLSLVGRTRFRERFLPDFPLLWNEDPATRVLYPFWVRREHAMLFQRFVVGQQPPDSLPDELVDKLVEAAILQSPRDFQSRANEGVSWVNEARPRFEKDRYCVLPALIRRSHVDALDRYFRALIEHGEWAVGDEQVRRRYGYHNEQLSRYFHHQLCDFVARVAGEPVKPTYSYVSAYQPGAVLSPHVDRKQCVFTLSLWIDSTSAATSRPWPLWFQTSTGPVSLTQTAGDAVLFRGCELPHWRDEPPLGSASTALLFHYVPRDFSGVLD